MTAGAPTIRPMAERDVAEAARVSRRAFGTFLGATDVENFRRDLGTIETRFRTEPELAFVAEAEGRLLGSIMGMAWGSQLVLGPLSVDPRFWGRGVARRLAERFLAEADARRVPLVTLFTFPQSAMHLHLYESLGFAAEFLTPLLGKVPTAPASAPEFRRFSSLSPDARNRALAGCRSVAEANLAGLDLTPQIRAVVDQRLGEILLIESGGTIAGFAICHVGAGTEAGEGMLYVKFAAARPGAAAEFERLLDSVETFALERGIARNTAGVNTGRRDAHRRMVGRGYRAGLVGVAMHRPDGPGTLRSEVYVLDDWR